MVAPVEWHVKKAASTIHQQEKQKQNIHF